MATTKLRAAREAAGLESREAAEIAGLSAAGYSRIESGQRTNLREDTRVQLERLAKRLGRPLSELVAAVAPKAKPKPKPKGRPKVLPKCREAAQVQQAATTPPWGSPSSVVAPKELEALPPVMSVEQAAKFLAVSRGTLFTAIREGQIPSKKIGKRRVIVRDALWQWLTK